ncbi:mammalian cell entry protein [Mycobacterium kyorinense]|uniref:Mammalian cell entry protein n=1 Tax=Mycobacterium kyorinense TaxID=487514 RepID=A0A1A2YTM9_9MYCO|nr:virulence factor Mce family protein [Mycobacterium kyorinense]OBI41360.1 mammalian cell entry protein [Mycobacterium kyorinense]
MRTLEPANRVRVGAMAIVIAALVVGVGQSFSSVPMLFAQPSYYAQFSDTGGLSKGDTVRIAGKDVGTVQSVAIEGNHIVMKFSTGTHTIGTKSRLAIKTETVLGKKVLEVEPWGSEKLRPNGVLPLGQSTTPYQIYDAFFDVTKAAAGWDIDTVKKSLNVLSQTVSQTSPHLSAALDGVARFSDTLGKRDDQIKHLLTQARKVAGVLGDRGEQINALLVNARALLAAFNQRDRDINALLGNVAAFSGQVQGLINDNPNLNHLLEQLRTVTDVLVKHQNDLVSVLTSLQRFTASLSEAVSSGPYFKVMVANLLPYQILQPWVDAAFKKRGLDPEDFWRSAGLPAFRFPDPNGTRFPNGAPPPAPPVLEGTPDHPGPAVAPGSPCSYTPSPELLPRPGNPMPCAGIDQEQGPFGPNGPYPALPDVLSSPPNPNGLPPTPGIPSGGRQGLAPPDVPGTPVPLPPAPHGARTEPVGPATGPGPLPAVPPAPPPPGPPAPPGPGPQLPAPFITPGGTGGSSQ